MAMSIPVGPSGTPDPALLLAMANQGQSQGGGNAADSTTVLDQHLLEQASRQSQAGSGGMSGA